jgi:alanyl-tRNA synthetase
MRNHTATHLLQGALKAIVGKHITQQGSFVGPDYLRFDFTNPEALSPGQIADIESRVNEQIMLNIPVCTQVLTLEEARRTGAIAPFGEKYGQTVRVVDVPEWDLEFCGGTHMTSTGGIGPFVILSESAIASGVRRIEATTGRNALEVIQSERGMLKNLGEQLSVPREKVGERLTGLLDEMKGLRKQMAQLRAKSSAGAAGDILERATEVSGIKVIAEVLPDAEAGQLREMFDALKSRRQQNLFVALGSASGGRVTLLCGATPDAAERVSAGDVVKKLAPIVGGSGGGRREMAQAGGKDPARLEEAIRSAPQIVAELLGA